MTDAERVVRLVTMWEDEEDGALGWTFSEEEFEAVTESIADFVADVRREERRSFLRRAVMTYGNGDWSVWLKVSEVDELDAIREGES